MAEMVKLFVNGVEVEVEAGKNLIDAIGAIGIKIPHFCYHPALGADGNCRMCLVGIEDGRPPLVPACKTPAQAGMKVLIDAEKIKKIQRDVMELELINHPIDCPICDQAGECALQDYYMEYDRQGSRMRVPVVQKSKNLDFGCGVVHDQERCVLCARCVRFTRMITKTGELGIVNRTDGARVTIFPGRPLNNRYALNVVDLCPVGAMTSKDFRFKQRSWFLSKEKGICHGCSKGCNIYIDHNKEKYKDDVIYRFRPRLNKQVNGYFMCDEGRLGYHQENENRIQSAMIGGKIAETKDALAAAKTMISGSKSILFIISPNSSLEQIAAIKQLATVCSAHCSGYSDAYIQKGDGDTFLIEDDKSANRTGITLLGVDQSKAFFDKYISAADTVVVFDNDLFRFDKNAELASQLGSKNIISVCSRATKVTAIAKIVIPCASFSEYAGTVINSANVLQLFTKAVKKNKPQLDILEIASALGGNINTVEQAWVEIKTTVPVLATIGLSDIPEEGIQLNRNEGSNVSA